MLYKNDSDETRVWPGISRPDGTTLELEHGEEVELDKEIHDAHLKPVGWELAEPPEQVADEPQQGEDDEQVADEPQQGEDANTTDNEEQS